MLLRVLSRAVRSWSLIMARALMLVLSRDIAGLFPVFSEIRLQIS